MKVNRIGMTLGEKAEIENAMAQQAKNAATIEYVAMMADVDLDEDEEESEEPEGEEDEDDA